ncbi:efflux RND transporter periplasmic adaptor subunit [Altererythrobacter indicus]|uniref:Efflux RND transporter periplasmic adaptor subunit n=1 Tax=Altericroceibacterium indicum TaxID=374177 RepID=A0A845AHF6_9SPHN|nr:efflux RND transporter periplasmic adaptor subunit [Altericroceibacterium indicum]MXP26538.1 efflux RND transporter periplasmic adaptor subunit [Altericroceibacterium indicum]
MESETTDTLNQQPVLNGETLEAEQHSPRFTRSQKIVGGIAAVVIIILAWLMLSGGKEERPFADNDGQAPAVSVITPGTGAIADDITATGTLAARREMPVGVVGEGGRVVSVQVEPGDWVKAGQTLAVIDRSVQNQQATSSAAQIDVAKADAKLAQANLDRALKLVDRGFISTADIDRLTATRDSAVAQVKVAQAQYRELLARNNRLNITAPAAGLVLTRDVEPGQVVGAGSAVLFNIARDGQMEMLAELGENDLASVKVGVVAEVTPVGTDKTFKGQVWQVAPVIDQNNRQGIARIALNYAKELRPGGFATARIAAGSVNAPMLPESAILSDEKGSYVYIVGKDNKTERRAVKTGLVTEKGIAITSGLKGSEKIVLRAGAFLTEGEAVRPVASSKE